MNAQVTSLKITDQKDPSAIVTALFSACEALDFDRVLELLHEDCVYQNMPFHVARGKQRVKRDLNLMAKGMNVFKVEMVNMAVNGNVVLTERVDTIGGWFFEIDIPLMGVLVVQDEKIIEWRDYFDWSNVIGNFGKSAVFSRLGLQK